MKETFLNLKRIYDLTKENNKSFIVYLVLIPFLCIISVILPLFTASQIMYISDNVYKELLFASITVFVLSVLLNIIKHISNTSLNNYFKDSFKVLRIKALEVNSKSKKDKLDDVLDDVTLLESIVPKIINHSLEIIISFGLLLTILFINRFMFIFLVAAAILIYEVKTMVESNLENEKKIIKYNNKINSLISKYTKSTKKSTKEIDEIKKMIDEVNTIKFEEETKLSRFGIINKSVISILNLALIVMGIKLLKKSLINAASFITVFIYKDHIFKMVDSYVYLTDVKNEFNNTVDEVITYINK